MYFAPHAVDGVRFTPFDEPTLAASAKIRRELQLGDRRVLLFAGKLHPRKQPLALLRAFLKVADSRHALVFVGEGTEASELKSLAGSAPGSCVRFLPFANQSAMPAVYGAADVFCLPSAGFYETWGLAVNEAMHMGLPCIVSDLVGCQRDLVIPGQTGWVFPAVDHCALAAQVSAALTTPDSDLKGMGTNARKLVNGGFTYGRATEGLLGALGHCMGARL
jgi:glycosyltransferase involved in cell wall biosynthesis